MDLEDGTKTLDKVDGFLTKFGTVLKKHWGKLLLIGTAIVVWWFGKEVLKEYDATQSEEYYDESYTEDTEEYSDEDYSIEQSYE